MRVKFSAMDHEKGNKGRESCVVSPFEGANTAFRTNYCATEVVSVEAAAVSDSTTGAGASVAGAVSSEVLVSVSAGFEVHEAARDTTKAATSNLNVFFINFGLKFPFHTKNAPG